MGRFICEYYSRSLNREIRIHVLLPTPPHSAADCLYPAVYLLHGGANDCSVLERYTSVERYLVSHELAGILFSAENKYYRTLWNESLIRLEQI